MQRSIFPSSAYKQIDFYVMNMQWVLGKGSYGSIVLSFDLNHDMFLAIKIISLDNLTDPKALDYLKSEIKNMQLAKHPNVVRLLDVRRSRSNIYLIMEYCEGGNLEKYVYDRGGRLSEKETLRILRKIIKGYKYLHSLNIVHRDLKLANILTHQGEVKIADLGYSKLMENLKTDFLISRVGTMLYMSPQILEAEHYTNKTDVWSLGIMFYQMLFGKNPWIIQNIDNSKLSVKSFLKNIRENGLIFPKEVKISEKSKNLIKEMLMYDEEDRLSWEEVFQEAFLQEEDEENAMEIEGGYEYFRRYRIIENIYDCEHVMKKTEIAVPHLKLMEIVTSQEFTTNNINNSMEKKNVVEVFIKKSLEDNEKIVRNRIFRLLMQKRNKMIFYLWIFEEILMNYKEKIEFVSLLALFIMNSFIKIRDLKAIPKYFIKEEVEIFMKAKEKEIFIQFIDKETEFLIVLMKTNGFLETSKLKKQEFLIKMTDFLKKIKDRQESPLKIINKLLIIMNIEQEFKNKKLLSLDFNKVYEELY